MAKAHEVTIGADAKAFEQGIRKGIINPLEDAEDALDDLGDAASDAGRQGSRDLGKVEDAAEKLERQLRDAQDQTKKLDRGFKDAGDSAGRSMAHMGDQAAEVGDEIRQNLGEGITSAVEGDFANLGNVIGDTLGGTVAGIGGIGTAAFAAAGALGIGAVTAAWTAANAETEKNTERANNYFQTLVDGAGRVTESNILSGIQEYLTDADKMAEVQRLVSVTGLEQSVVLRALNGDLQDGQAVTERLAVARDELAAAEKRNMDAGKSSRDGLTDQNQALLRAEDLWKKYNGVVEDGTTKWDTYSDAASMGAIRTAEAAAAAGTATKTIDKFGDAVYELPDGKKIYVDAETGKATEDLEEFNRFNLNHKIAYIEVRPDTSAWDSYVPKPKRGAVDVYVTKDGRQLF